MTDVTKVNAEVIDTPTKLGEAGKWLSDAQGEVAKLVASGDFEPFEITSEADYRQEKRNRQALRKRIQEMDGQRKGMTRSVEEAVKKFKDGAKDALAPLTERDAKMKRELDAWDEQWQSRRRADLAQEYADFAEELADMVSFDVLEEKYAAAGKWYNRSTSDAAAEKSMDEAAQAVAQSLATVDSLNYAEDGRQASVRAKFCLTLDLSGAIDAERREWEAAKAAREHAEAEAQRAKAEAQRSEDAPQTEREPEFGAETEPTDNYTATGETEPNTASEPPAEAEPEEPMLHVEFRCYITPTELAQMREYLRGRAQFRVIKE